MPLPKAKSLVTQAIEDLTASLNQEPDHVWALMIRSKCYGMLGKFLALEGTDARETLQLGILDADKAAGLSPEDPFLVEFGILRRLALARFEMEQGGEGEPILLEAKAACERLFDKKWIEEHPQGKAVYITRAEVFLSLARCLIAKRRGGIVELDQCQQDCLSYIQTNPSGTDLSHAFTVLGMELTTYIQNIPTPRFAALSQKAYDAFQEAIKYDSANWEAYEGLGDLLAHLGQMAEAANAYSSAIEKSGARTPPSLRKKLEGATGH